ncbi:hypothetical protein SBV1_140012 [Verrucomicrobia bacterium]|nr:hypothetical protein SBV1_140012 [Verrucomicrobiota bacterium]
MVDVQLILAYFDQALAVVTPAPALLNGHRPTAVLLNELSCVRKPREDLDKAGPSYLSLRGVGK